MTAACCASLGNQDSGGLHYCFLTAPLYLCISPIPHLAVIWTWSLQLREGPGGWMKTVSGNPEMGDTGSLLCPGAPHSLAWHHDHPLTGWVNWGNYERNCWQGSGLPIISQGLSWFPLDRKFNMFYNIWFKYQTLVLDNLVFVFFFLIVFLILLTFWWFLLLIFLKVCLYSIEKCIFSAWNITIALWLSKTNIAKVYFMWTQAKSSICAFIV